MKRMMMLAILAGLLLTCVVGSGCVNIQGPEKVDVGSKEDWKAYGRSFKGDSSNND